MDRKDRIRRILYRTAAVLLAVLVIMLSVPPKKETETRAGIGQLVTEQVESAAAALWCPALTFAGQTREEGIWHGIYSQFPILYIYGKEKEIRLQAESSQTYEDIIRAEGHDEYTDSLSEEELKTPESSDGRVQIDGQMAELLQQENGRTQDKTEEKNDGNDIKEDASQEKGKDQSAENALPQAAATGMVEEYQWEYYRKYDALVKEFYAVDAATAIDESQLNLEALLGRDLSISKRQDDKPQILIYHTHSQEDFADSIPGDASTTIMGVGEVLTQILKEQYGYNVMHHLGQYDVEKRDYAYSNSLPALEQLLAENPSIEVVIDLHRDEVASDRKLVTEIDGRQTAMFMFFNGLSRTRKHGDIEYLPNVNLADNLAFSFQMQTLCNEYYPGLTRRIYLKGYRYNMHLKARYLLIEMGAQTNTYEECYNACIPLARMLDMELSGTDFGYDGGVTEADPLTP